MLFIYSTDISTGTGKRNGDQGTEVPGVAIRTVMLRPNYSTGRGKRLGLVVDGVMQGSLAAKNDIRRNDLIIYAEGRPVKDSRELTAMIQASWGDVFIITIERHGQIIRKAIPLKYSSGSTSNQVNKMDRVSWEESLRGELKESMKKELAGTVKPAATIKSTPVKVEKEVIVEQPVKVESIINIKLSEVTILPNPVNAGANFDLKIDYIVEDTEAKGETIEFLLNYSIWEGKNVKFQKEVNLNAPSGIKHSSKKKGLRASKKRGLYKMKVEISYKGKTDTKTIDLRIR
jgi:membrane-associated protease RseP (regulator of RpoE activity)